MCLGDWEKFKYAVKTALFLQPEMKLYLNEYLGTLWHFDVKKALVIFVHYVLEYTVLSG